MTDDERPIADGKKNQHVVTGPPEHRPTQLAPPSFFKPLNEEVQKICHSRFEDVERVFWNALGSPFHEEPGFLLYNADCVDVLERLANSDRPIDLTVTSPPYNIGKAYEKPVPLEEYVDWCSRFSRRGMRLISAASIKWMRLTSESKMCSIDRFHSRS